MVAATLSLGDHSVMEGDRISPLESYNWKRNVVSLVSCVIIVMRLSAQWSCRAVYQLSPWQMGRRCEYWLVWHYYYYYYYCQL